MACNRTTWPESPLVNCDGSTYFGRDMGLYGGNSNVRPPAIEAQIQAAVANIPTDQPVGLVLMGQSTALTTINALLARSDFQAARRSNVVVVNAAHGGYEMEEWANSAGSGIGWQYLQTLWAGAGITAAQVYAVLMINTFVLDRTNNPTDTVARLAADELRVRNWRNIVMRKLPNTKVIYAAGLHPLYAANVEPWLSYESSLAWRSAMLAAPLPNDAPLLAPVYQWSKGSTPNAQGTAWTCPEYYQTDGIHQTPAGANYGASLFAPLFLSDATTGWFRN